MSERGLSIRGTRQTFFGLVGAQLTAASARPWTRLLVRALAVLGLMAILVFFATAGTLRFERGMRYYDELGAALLRGHLYVAQQPSAELLALPNPYDATQNHGLVLHDASLYNGHFYLYFGPAPALIHTVWHLLAR